MACLVQHGMLMAVACCVQHGMLMAVACLVYLHDHLLQRDLECEVEKRR
jgi:hypothetical protein